MFLLRGFRRAIAHPVVLDVHLLRDIHRTQAKIDGLLDVLPDFQAQLRDLAEIIERRDADPELGAGLPREDPTE